MSLFRGFDLSAHLLSFCLWAQITVRISMVPLEPENYPNVHLQQRQRSNLFKFVISLTVQAAAALVFFMPHRLDSMD